MRSPAVPEIARPAASFAAPDSANSDRFWIGAMIVLIVGIAARQLLLGPAPFHPDEAIHAFFAQGFDTYHYDPVYHGPLLYHLVAGVFGIFGAYDFTARLVPSVLGIGLLALILFPMRRFASNKAAIAGAALVAISPSIVTYSRHLLHDSLVLFLTMGAVLCFLWTLNHSSDSRSGRGARVGLTAFLTLFLATKANFFFIAVMLLAFWLAWKGSGWLRLPVWLERWTPALCFVVVTACAILFPRDNTFEAPVQVFQHKVFQIVAVACCGVFWLWLMSWREKPEAVEKTSKKTKKKGEPVEPQFTNPKEQQFTYFLVAITALLLYVFLFGSVAQIAVQWVQTRHFPVATAASGAISALTAIRQMWDYWAGQQATPRLPGRHDYYVVLALLYEVPILIAAAGGIYHAARNRSVFTDLLLWWSFTSWTVYAVANEKVPWLIVHVCLPLALLGGVWLAQLKLGRPAWLVALALGAFFSLRGDYAMIFQRAGDNAEPILYAQSPDAFRDVVQNALAATRGDTRALWMNNDDPKGRNRQWPSVWYFRKAAPDVGESNNGIGNTLNIVDSRLGITTPDDLPNVGAMTRANWNTQTVDFLIWPRASWTALQPRRYWKWFWTRDTFPQSERGKPQEQWTTSILGGTTVYRVPKGAPPGAPAVPVLIGKGEWSNAQAVVGWRKN